MKPIALSRTTHTFYCWDFKNSTSLVLPHILLHFNFTFVVPVNWKLGTYMGCSWKSAWFHFFKFLNLTFPILFFCNFFNQDKYWNFMKSILGASFFIFSPPNSPFYIFGPKIYHFGHILIFNCIFVPKKLKVLNNVFNHSA